MQTLDPSSHISVSNGYATNRQNFLSLDQSRMPNAKTTLCSDKSLEEVYRKTLSAYQNDVNQLNEIERTRKEISNRILNHKNILQSIQVQGDPQSASAVLSDSVV